MAPPSRWRGWQNAEIYDGFARRDGIYRWLNRELAVSAELANARRVLDLACGTGATAEACLALLPRDAELIGVDGSAEMVGVARARLRDPRAGFRVADAEDLAEALGGPFDRALCNAAFWQFHRPTAVFAGLAVLLSPGALFVFNAPAERVTGEATRADPYQQALARAVEAETGRPIDTGAGDLDPERLTAELATAGFELLRRERRIYRGRQGELMELMEVPAMVRPLAGELPQPVQDRVLARARRDADPARAVEVPWVFFTARRR